MSQLNIHLTGRFERALQAFMKARGIRTKSEAVRLAVEEAADRAVTKPVTNWDDLIGIANQYPSTPPETWLTEDELWETNRH
ncbi:MAG: hypothetical protein JO353_05205 [Phycisphaerae bacterium]|nr:hypothetical protein [Phycisphaerae bacterium]